MTFGKRLRELRQAEGLTLRDLASKVGVGFTYLSKIENHKLEDGHSPSENLIHKLAVELDANEDELLLLAEKIPHQLRRRLAERPDAFMKMANLDDDGFDDLLRTIEGV